MSERITIGELSERTGVATSALRYYEDEGLITAERTPAGQRRYPREVIRRVSFIRIAQTVGLTLDEIGGALRSLPEERTPTKADWARLSRRWQPVLDERIATLVRLRDDLTSCIGCGCLSLTSCRLSNWGDEIRVNGPGPRFLLGDARSEGT